jgi:hypothetical protein
MAIKLMMSGKAKKSQRFGNSLHAEACGVSLDAGLAVVLLSIRHLSEKGTWHAARAMRQNHMTRRKFWLNEPRSTRGKQEANKGQICTRISLGKRLETLLF